jgi:hypothetical protein
MEFCCDRDGAWSQCVIANRPGTAAQIGFDLHEFDADAGRGGVLEVAIRIERSVAQLGLSIWYGDYPYRKKITLLTAKDTAGGLSPQTLVFYLKPELAECPEYRAADLQTKGFENFPPECVAQANPVTHRVCADGRWSVYGARCAFDYSNSWLYLTAESCESRVASNITLFSVRYFARPLNCACQGTGACAAGSHCALEAAIEAPWCADSNPLCGGLCTKAGQTP